MFTHQLKALKSPLILVGEVRNKFNEKMYINDGYFLAYKDDVVEPYLKPDPMDGVPVGTLALVRDSADCPWAVRAYQGAFSVEYMCADGISTFGWKHCIPLAGNEHLAFTKDMPSDS